MSDIGFNTKLNLGCLSRNAFSYSAVKSLPEEAKYEKGGIYVKPTGSTSKQKDTIERAINELETVRFNPLNVIYLRSMGIKPPYKNGREAVKFLRDKGAEIAYAEFSNPNVHACLDTTKQKPSVLINSAYKDMASDTDILAISEALLHEAGHAKDSDSLNSIQEELDCLSLNVLAHEYYKSKGHNFNEQTSPLYVEGVNLYNKLFFDPDPNKSALKQRVAEKYGYLDVFSAKHPPSKLACDIKTIVS